MKYVHSDVPSTLDVREELYVHGRLRSGARVHAGQHLFVYGAVEGSLEVERDGLLVVGGLLAAFVDANEGTIAVAGTVSTPLETVPGRLLLSEGSVASVDGGSRVVTSRGFRPVPDHRLVTDELEDLPVLRRDDDGARLHPEVSDVFRRLSDAMRR
ncbi:hypothetical protein [Curtobacterium sp. MCBD17_030]|uniref:hypothetical protein n=1 Tax=Curtobacterium sp. MCBD17_030 TaxID=2175649 RepID=UPI000D9A134C|nr:hypothetical protein [Curtobacterium sp. MCBD17_030]PYY36423.1 hypothetical protein DEI89_04435 [Curtobacterium sp. MCBD17_030]